MEAEERRLLGAQFDLDAQGYDDGRPDYPAGAWQQVLAHLDLTAGSRVLEIGPGTGQATARLLATGATVEAVEPGAELSALLRTRFADADLQVQTATLEAAELADGSFDAVASATAFHWVDPDVGIPVLRRVLRPGAPVCLWWNVYRDPARDEVDPIDALVRGSTELPNTRGLNGILDELDLPARLTEAGFVDVRTDVVRWTGRHDEERLIKLFRSFSDMRKRTAAERDLVLGRLRTHARAAGGVVERAYTTPMIFGRAPD